MKGFASVMLQSLVGLVLGILVNALNKAAEARLAVYDRPAAGVLLKLVPVAAAALGLGALFPAFSAEWQVTIPGLFFVTMYFGTQTSLMEDVVRLA